MIRDSEGHPLTAMQAEIAAVVAPALTTATEKWAGAPGRASEPVVAGVATHARQISHLCDELKTVDLDGLEMARRVQDLRERVASLETGIQGADPCTRVTVLETQVPAVTALLGDAVTNLGGVDATVGRILGVLEVHGAWIKALEEVARRVAG